MLKLLTKKENHKNTSYIEERRRFFWKHCWGLGGFYTRHIGIEVFQHIFVKVATWTTQRKNDWHFHLPEQEPTNRSFGRNLAAILQLSTWNIFPEVKKTTSLKEIHGNISFCKQISDAFAYRWWVIATHLKNESNWNISTTLTPENHPFPLMKNQSTSIMQQSMVPLMP